MNGKSENSGNWAWLRNLLLVIAVVGLIAAMATPNYIGGGPNEQPSPIINNLRQIDGAKNEWAFERGFTNESQVLQLTNQLTEKDLLPYLYHDSNQSNNLVVPAAGEIYTIGRFDTGPEAKLTKKLKLRNETWPQGTIIRLATDPDTGFPYQVIFPDGTKKHYEILK